MPKVSVPESEIPEHFQEAIKDGKVGGVFLVYLTGKNTAELEEKKEKIKGYCDRLRAQYDPDHRPAIKLSKADFKKLRNQSFFQRYKELWERVTKGKEAYA